MVYERPTGDVALISSVLRPRGKQIRTLVVSFGVRIHLVVIATTMTILLAWPHTARTMYVFEMAHGQDLTRLGTVSYIGS